MCPQNVGFDMKNLEFTETLPLIMGKLLQSIMQKDDDSFLNCIKYELAVLVEKYKSDFIDFEKIVTDANICNDLKQYVHGLCFLEQHNILNQLYNVCNVCV